MNKKIRNTVIRHNDALEVTAPSSQFGDLFKPQMVKLSPPSNGHLPQQLPPELLLIPKFENGNFDLKVSPQNWIIYNSMINTINKTNGGNETNGSNGTTGANGVSIVLVNAAGTVLALHGINDAQSILPAKGVWSTNVSPQTGDWESKLLDITDPAPQTLWWIFLLSPYNATPTVMETVIFEFPNVGPLDLSYQSTQAFPGGWTAFLQFTQDGMQVTVLSPYNRTFTLTGGAFSGALGQLVCNGTFTSVRSGTVRHVTVSSDSTGPDTFNAAQDGEGDGTWTGTSGGPL